MGTVCDCSSKNQHSNKNYGVRFSGMCWPTVPDSLEITFVQGSGLCVCPQEHK